MRLFVPGAGAGLLVGLGGGGSGNLIQHGSGGRQEARPQGVGKFPVDVDQLRFLDRYGVDSRWATTPGIDPLWGEIKNLGELGESIGLKRLRLSCLNFGQGRGLDPDAAGKLGLI